MKDEYQKYLESAVRFLSYRPRSEKEVRDNLVKKKAPEEIIFKVVTWLREQKFLNDAEFARWWIEQRMRYRQRGMQVIRQELRQKGIQDDVIIDATQQFDTQEIQDDAIQKLLAKRLPKYRDLPKPEMYQKLGAFLARRGYEWDVIRRNIDELLRNGV